MTPYEKRLLHDLKQYRNQLTRQELKTLVGQVKAGDPDGAIRGLYAITKRRKEHDRQRKTD